MKVVVVGGGFAGVTAALELSRLGHAVTLLERRGVLGGRATSSVDMQSGDAVENGNHLLLGSHTAARDLFTTLGLETALVEHVEPTDPTFLAWRRQTLGVGEGPLVLRARPFADVWDAVLAHLGRRGATIRRRALAERVLLGGGRAVGVRYFQRAETKEAIRAGVPETIETVAADAVVLALPLEDARVLLAGPPGAPERTAHAAEAVAYVTVDLWLEIVACEPTLLALSSGAGLYAVDKGRLFGRSGAPQHLSVTIDPIHAARPRSNAEWTTAAEAGLRAQLPSVDALTVKRALVMKESHDKPPHPGATLATLPSLPNVVLAGDWQSALAPGTIEGAVRSGIAAAGAVHRHA